ncbi:hypothetical protein SDC9_154715 [bioreactor metagenome]|uniref:Uncharacterized protein n=1 Tax=bioreactor metagenome TaxID=1076179 RepID=A0A645EZG2_9ZZZZ
MGQQHLPGRGGVRRQPAGDPGHVLQATVALELVDVDHVEAVAQRQVDRLLGERHQLADVGSADFAQGPLARDELAQLEQAQPEAVVDAGLLQQPHTDHLAGQPVDGGLGQAAAGGELGQALLPGVVVECGQDEGHLVEQREDVTPRDRLRHGLGHVVTFGYGSGRPSPHRTAARLSRAGHPRSPRSSRRQ